MEKIFKAKSEDNGKWYEFSLFDIDSIDDRVVMIKVSESGGYAFLLVETLCQISTLDYIGV